MGIHWLIDTLLLETGYQGGGKSLSEAAQSLGHRVTELKYIPALQQVDRQLEFDSTEAVIAYGSIQFCKYLERSFGQNLGTPGLYFNQNVKHYAKFAPYVPLLNDDYVILPYAEVRKRYPTGLGMRGDQGIFIKPESGLKEFVGQVITCAEDYEKLSPHAAIDPSTPFALWQSKSLSRLSFVM